MKSNRLPVFLAVTNDFLFHSLHSHSTLDSPSYTINLMTGKWNTVIEIDGYTLEGDSSFLAAPAKSCYERKET